ncbi:MAG: ABC transporter substrate-binding protein [Actinomycetota bacterium]
MILRQRSLRWIGIAGALALLATACGDDTDEPEAAAPSTSVSTTVAEPSPTTAPAPTGTIESSTPPPAAVADLIVVDLTDSVFDLALLGVAPVGNIYGSELVAPTLAALDGVTPEVADAILAAPDLAASGGFEINVEAVAAAQPDLIITSPTWLSFYRLTVEQLEAIAPVAQLDDELGWQDRARQLGELVGAVDEAERRIADVEQRLQVVAQRVSDAGLEGTVVSLLRPGFTTFLQSRSLGGRLLASVGLTQPEPQLADLDTGFPDYAAQTQYSEELLGDHDGDALIVLAEDPSLEPAAAFAAGSLAGEVLAPLTTETAISVPIFLWATNTLSGAGQIAQDLERLVELLDR